MKKHQILTGLTVEKLIFGGKGLALSDEGKKIIITGGVIPGAIVSVRILKIRKNYIEAQVVATEKKSPLEQPIPENWQLYGGCKWLPIPYKEQLKIKSQQVKEAFRDLEKIQNKIPFSPIIASPLSEGYRNKLEFSWGKYISKKEEIHDEYRFGFHVPGAFDRIENCTYCVLADDTINMIFKEIDTLARESSFATYDPKRQDGFWRHLVVRKSEHYNQIMLIFSVNTNFPEAQKALDYIRESIEPLTQKFPQIVSVFIFHNPGKADIVTGEPEKIFGQDFITEQLLGMDFDIQPKSFFQVNSQCAELLYRTVIEQFLSKKGILLDLYAGTGTIGMLLSEHFETVYSVELVESSSKDASINARKNNISNMHFVNAKVEDFAKEFLESGNTADTLVIDPPRSGMHPKAIPTLLKFDTKEIVYVSCNPATLARDLEAFLSAGYEIRNVIPVDMFPHTHHIETVVHLLRK